MFDLRLLPPDAAERAARMGEKLSEIRVRAGLPVFLKSSDGITALCEPIAVEAFRELTLSLMDYSLYARQSELNQGYFTLADGSRAGICGDFTGGSVHGVSEISSLCVRVSREVPGCADRILDAIDSCRGALIVSPPGMGKTTLLRDIARGLSGRGKNVCVIDERGEIAACREGRPRLNVGRTTDVITGIDRAQGMMLAVRSCAPDVIVTDEIGNAEDARAVEDALRCGVSVVASAHGDTLTPGGLRREIAGLLRADGLNLGILLGGKIGEIRALSCGGEIWNSG